MNLFNNFSYLSIPLWILAILGFLVAFTIAYLAIPLIVKAAVKNNLYANLNGRSSHTKPTPVLGGVAIFTGFILSTIIVAGAFFSLKLIYIISGVIIIFIAGLKDDVMNGKPRKKLLGQIIVAINICMLADVRISNLHELFNIGDIPYSISIVITIFVLIVLMNSFNLIDGINGLASGIGILTSSILGIWFFLTNNFAYTIMSFALTGALAAFVRFNVFSKKNKIFLGDAGSLLTGLILGLLTVRFLQLEPSAKGLGIIKSTPAFAISLFIVPLFDTLRIFTIRIMQGKSPFKADRQHLHHRLLDLGFNHLQTTLILLSFNLAFIVITYLLQDLGNIFLLGMLLLIATIFSQILLFQVKKRNRKVMNTQYPVNKILKKNKKYSSKSLRSPKKVNIGLD